MNFFQLQNQLFYQRKSKAEELDPESSSAFVPYLINRWLSFYGRDQAAFTNLTLNRFGYIFDDKNKLYKLYYNLIPRMRYKKISYVKKQKKEEKEPEVTDVLKRFAADRGISTRELLAYVNCK